MRDGTVGLLVCGMCRKLVEFPTVLDGPLRPSPADKRWFGTDGEREDLVELGLHAPPLPERHAAIDEMHQRLAQQTDEPGSEDATLTDPVALDQNAAEFERRRRQLDE